MKETRKKRTSLRRCESGRLFWTFRASPRDRATSSAWNAAVDDAGFYVDAGSTRSLPTSLCFLDRWSGATWLGKGEMDYNQVCGTRGDFFLKHGRKEERTGNVYM